MTPLEETLQLALQDFGLRALPKEWKPNAGAIFVDGIALVVKATGKEYARVANSDGKISIVRDYGRCSMVIAVEKYYAVNTIDKSAIPDLRSDKQIVQYLCKSVYDPAEIEALLSKEGKTPEQAKADRDEVKRRVNDLALKYQKRKLAEEKRVKNIGNVYGTED